jgi:hypothetical protein
VSRKAVKLSVADELAALTDVLESAQLLAELLDTKGLPDDDTTSRAPRMLVAVIGLAVDRLAQLRRAITQQGDVASLVNRRNRRASVARGEDADVLLPVRRRG